MPKATLSLLFSVSVFGIIYEIISKHHHSLLENSQFVFFSFLFIILLFSVTFDTLNWIEEENK